MSGGPFLNLCECLWMSGETILNLCECLWMSGEQILNLCECLWMSREWLLNLCECLVNVFESLECLLTPLWMSLHLSPMSIYWISGMSSRKMLICPSLPNLCEYIFKPTLTLLPQLRRVTRGNLDNRLLRFKCFISDIYLSYSDFCFVVKIGSL